MNEAGGLRMRAGGGRMFVPGALRETGHLLPAGGRCTCPGHVAKPRDSKTLRWGWRWRRPREAEDTSKGKQLPPPALQGEPGAPTRWILKRELQEASGNVRENDSHVDEWFWSRSGTSVSNSRPACRIARLEACGLLASVLTRLVWDHGLGELKRLPPRHAV